MKATDKKENKKISIRAKIFLAFLCIIGIAIALLWLCQVVLFDVVYNNVRIGEIETTARYVLRHTDKADFYSQLDFAVAKNNLCAVILSPDGEVTLSCENSNACLLHSLTLSERRELIEIAKDKDKVTFGLSYECPSPNSPALTKLFHTECERHGVMHDNEEIFRYLRAFPQKDEGEQLSFF